MNQVVNGIDNRQSRTYVCFKQVLHPPLTGNRFQFAIVLVSRRCSDLIGCHYGNVVLQKVFVKWCNVGACRTIHEYGVEDIHSDYFVTDRLQVTILAFLLQLFTEISKIEAFATEHGFRSIDDTYDVQLQSVLHHQLLLLATNLFYQTTANRTDTADKEIQYLIFGQEEGVMDNVQRFTQWLGIDNKRNVGFRSSLRTSDNIDTITSQCTEELSCYTRCMLHILANDCHRSQISLCKDRRNLSHLNLFRKFFIQHFTSQIGISVPNTDRGTVLWWSLRNEEYTDSILCQSLEDTVVYTDHTYHTQPLNSDQTRIIDRGNTFNGLTLRIGSLLLDNCSHSVRIERILYYNRNILMTYRIDRRRINNFRTEVTKFGCFYIAQFGNSISCWDHTRIGSHKAIHIGPYLQTAGIERCGNNGSRIIRTTTTKIRYVSRHLIRRNKSGNQRHFRNGMESLFY